MSTPGAHFILPIAKQYRYTPPVETQNLASPIDSITETHTPVETQNLASPIDKHYRYTTPCRDAKSCVSHRQALPMPPVETQNLASLQDSAQIKRQQFNRVSRQAKHYLETQNFASLQDDGQIERYWRLGLRLVLVAEVVDAVNNQLVGD